MANIMVIAVVVLIVGLATAYIIKAKRSGVKCIGCPMAGECSHKNGEFSECGCGGKEQLGKSPCHSDTKE